MTSDLGTLLVPLLAQRDNWTRLGDRFTGHHLRLQTEDIVGGILLIAAAGLLFVGLTYARKIGERWSRAEEPRDVFRKLRDSHRLTRAERRLVNELAEHGELESRAEVFVRPELFESDASKRHGPIRALGEKLFSVSAEQTT